MRRRWSTCWFSAPTMCHRSYSACTGSLCFVLSKIKCVKSPVTATVGTPFIVSVECVTGCIRAYLKRILVVVLIPSPLDAMLFFCFVTTVWSLRRLHFGGQGAGVLPEDARQEEVQVNALAIIGHRTRGGQFARLFCKRRCFLFLGVSHVIHPHERSMGGVIWLGYQRRFRCW